MHSIKKTRIFRGLFMLGMVYLSTSLIVWAMPPGGDNSGRRGGSPGGGMSARGGGGPDGPGGMSRRGGPEGQQRKGPGRRGGPGGFGQNDGPGGQQKGFRPPPKGQGPGSVPARSSQGDFGPPQGIPGDFNQPQGGPGSFGLQRPGQRPFRGGLGEQQETTES